MPDKPTWYGQLNQAVVTLRALPVPWVDRQTLETILGVGRRRAQQILQPCVHRRIGSNGLANRDELIRHLEHLAAGEPAFYEQRRRQKLAKILHQAAEQAQRPRVLVEAPPSITGQQLASLPEGVSVSSGEIKVSFNTPADALQKLLALAMAIGNDLDAFERAASNTLEG